MSRLTRDGTAEPVSRDQFLRHERGQEIFIFPVQLTTCRTLQPYPVDPYVRTYDVHVVRRYFPPCVGRSEGLDAFRFFLKQ